MTHKTSPVTPTPSAGVLCCYNCQHWKKKDYIHCQCSGPWGGNLRNDPNCTWAAKPGRQCTFKVGDPVVWSSSANGSTKEKRGIVEAVVAAKTLPTRAQQKEADAYGMSRDHESYLVRVPGKSAGAKGKLYWPRVSVLKPA